MAAIVIDKSNCQLIPLNTAFDRALIRLYGREILSDLSENDYREWEENAKNPQKNVGTEIDKRWAARADIEQRMTSAFLAGDLIARAYTIDDEGNEKRCLLPIEFWEISPNSSFSMSAFVAFFHGIVEDTTRIKTILGFSKIIGWSVGVDEQAFLVWLNLIGTKEFISASEYVKPSEATSAKKLEAWNINQAICWIIFRDEALIPDYADGERSLTHLGIRQLYRDADDSLNNSYESFPNATEALIQKCRLNSLVAIGYKNDIGDVVAMTEIDWRNAGIFDDGQKTYVASKDHITAIGRTKWFGITFKSFDIMQEWPDDTHASKTIVAAPAVAVEPEKIAPLKICKLERRPSKDEVRDILREIYIAAPEGSKPNSSVAESECRKRIKDKFTKPAGQDSKAKEELIRVILREDEFANQRNSAGKQLRS